MPTILSGLFFLSLLGLYSQQIAVAGVIIGGTRIIYDASKKESSISVKNPEKKSPFLVQSWFEKYPNTPVDSIPFVITPPLFRLDGGKENILRIVRTGGNLPEDRESIYLANIKSIPASQESSENRLIISVKTQIKFIYRPEILKANADEAYKQLVFAHQNGQLSIKNATPYYISFHSILVDNIPFNGLPMISPKSSITLPLKISGASTVTWKAINDYGGVTEAETGSL